MKRKAITQITTTLFLAALVALTGCGKNAIEEPKGGGTTSTGSPAPAASNSNTPSSSTANPAANTTSNSGTTTAANPTPAPNTPAPAAYEKVTLGPLKVGEQAKLGPLSVTLIKTNVISDAAGIPPGYVYFLAELEIKNDGKDLYTINMTDHFKVETPEGKKAPYNVQATAYGNPRLQGSLEQGKSAIGWIGYLAKRVDGVYKYNFIHPDWGEATWDFGL